MSQALSPFVEKSYCVQWGCRVWESVRMDFCGTVQSADVQLRLELPRLILYLALWYRKLLQPHSTNLISRLILAWSEFLVALAQVLVLPRETAFSRTASSPSRAIVIRRFFQTQGASPAFRVHLSERVNQHSSSLEFKRRCRVCIPCFNSLTCFAY